jgi:hypothetical protein
MNSADPCSYILDLIKYIESLPAWTECTILPAYTYNFTWARLLEMYKLLLDGDVENKNRNYYTSYIFVLAKKF